MRKIAGKIILGFIGIACLLLLLFIGNKLGNFLFPAGDTVKILVKEGEIKSGGSLHLSLVKDFSVNETILLTRSLSKEYDPSKTRPGDKYKIYHSTSGEILKFIYMPSPLVNYVADRSTKGFIVSKLVPDIEEKLVAVKGVIHNSLYEGMVNAGVDVRTVMNFADIFQWQIDFFTEVMPDDKFLLVYIQYFVNGTPVESGHIILAGYKGKVGRYTAIRFNENYYDSKGNSFKKQFLKAPLRYKRISSHFSYRRMHPILKYIRPHLGIDYAAPVGTPVSSIGSGRVTHAGRKGGFGRTVVVRHNSIYTSQYGHLKSYAKGIRKGVYVKQGDDIGYVGSSGLSTGPHLDFRINKYSKPVNFLRLKLPPAKSVSKKNKEEFDKQSVQAGLYLTYLESDYFSGRAALIEDYKKTESYSALYQSKLQK